MGLFVNGVLTKLKFIIINFRIKKENLKKIEVNGVSGGDAVTVLLNGDGEMTKILLTDKVLKEDKEIILSKFQVNDKIMSITDNKAVFMHCLPAKIGSEVTEDVIKGKKSIVLNQAKNRLVAQKGILKWLSI